jgi:hypothetical protein
MPPDRGRPRLRFSPRAWLKFLYLCHAGPTEVAAFGLTREADPLLVDDLLVVKQWVTAATVAFDDAAVADLFDRMADQGYSPGRFGRIWLHTHPGSSVTPSRVDEATFDRVFGSCNWAVMGILGRTGRTYTRLRFSVGPGAAMVIPTAVEWADWPVYAQSPQFQEDLGSWQTEYDRLVEPVMPQPEGDFIPQTFADPFTDGPFDWLDGDDAFCPRRYLDEIQ